MTFPDVPCAELTLSEMLLVFFLAILGVIITVVSFFYVYGTFVDIKNYSERISEREIFESYTNIKKNLESSKKTLFFLIISFLTSDFFIVCKAPGLLMAFDYRNHDFTNDHFFVIPKLSIYANIFGIICCVLMILTVSMYQRKKLAKYSNDMEMVLMPADAAAYLKDGVVERIAFKYRKVPKKKYDEMKQQAVKEMKQYGLSAEDIVFHIHKCSEECKASERAKVFYILCAVALSSIYLYMLVENQGSFPEPMEFAKTILYSVDSMGVAVKFAIVLFLKELSEEHDKKRFVAADRSAFWKKLAKEEAV